MECSNWAETFSRRKNRQPTSEAGAKRTARTRWYPARDAGTQPRCPREVPGSQAEAHSQTLQFSLLCPGSRTEHTENVSNRAPRRARGVLTPDPVSAALAGARGLADATSRGRGHAGWVGPRSRDWVQQERGLERPRHRGKRPQEVEAGRRSRKRGT